MLRCDSTNRGTGPQDYGLLVKAVRTVVACSIRRKQVFAHENFTELATGPLTGSYATNVTNFPTR